MFLFVYSMRFMMMMGQRCSPDHQFLDGGLWVKKVKLISWLLKEKKEKKAGLESLIRVKSLSFPFDNEILLLFNRCSMK